MPTRRKKPVKSISEKKVQLLPHLEEKIVVVRAALERILAEAKAGERETIGSQTQLIREIQDSKELGGTLGFNQIQKIVYALRAMGIKVPIGVGWEKFSEERKKEIKKIMMEAMPQKLTQERINEIIDYAKRFGVIAATIKFRRSKGSIYHLIKRYGGKKII